MQTVVTIKDFDLNSNLNFYFSKMDRLNPYILGGMNLHLHTRTNHQEIGTPEHDYTTNDFSVGINTCVGLLWTFRNFHPYTEFLYTPFYLKDGFVYDNITLKLGFKVTIRKKPVTNTKKKW